MKKTFVIAACAFALSGTFALAQQKPAAVDPAKVDAYTRFVKASMKGWAYVLENPEEAAEIVVESDDTGAAEYDHQYYMVQEVTKLVDPNDPALDMTTYERTVQALLDQAIIKNQPEGAYTTVVTDALK